MCLCDVIYRGCSFGGRDVCDCVNDCGYARSRVFVYECVQRDGRTALYIASANGKEEAVEVLVSSGAAVNAATV
jgi:hypothetical protein